MVRMASSVSYDSRPALRRPVFIEGLPGVGNIGKLAADLMSEQLGATRFARIYSDDLPPQVMIDDDCIAEAACNELWYADIGDRDIVCICPGCSDELSAVDEGAVDFIQFLDARIGDLPRFERTVAVAMEPGCSAAPRAKRMKAVLEAMNCRVVNREWGCCGKSAPVAGELMAMRERECAGAEVIVVDCPMCHVKYDAYDGGIPVVHISELVAAAAGRTETLGFHRIPVPDLTGRSRFIE